MKLIFGLQHYFDPTRRNMKEIVGVTFTLFQPQTSSYLGYCHNVQWPAWQLTPLWMTPFPSSFRSGEQDRGPLATQLLIQSQILFINSASPMMPVTKSSVPVSSYLLSTHRPDNKMCVSGAGCFLILYFVGMMSLWKSSYRFKLLKKNCKVNNESSTMWQWSVCVLAALQYHSHTATWERSQQGSWERFHLTLSEHYKIYDAAISTSEGQVSSFKTQDLVTDQGAGCSIMDCIVFWPC